MYLIFAILALSFLIFIHELGHYLMAKRVGMRVETFSIGFGRPIFSWKRNGEEWKIGWLPFGGYVKIAGAETEKGEDLFAIKDGFFGKTPWERIKVAFMGPLVNLLFAVLAFAVLFALGGRQKNFADFTVKIGLVDPKSELYAAGVRPGDEIISYDGQLYQGAKDHLYAPMTSGSSHMEIKGFKVDPKTGEKKAFDAKIKPYQHPQAAEKGVLTAGILAPASYVIYDKLADGSSNPLPEGSPLANSGIQYGDRIIAVDGERIFSLAELNQVLNDGRALLTVKRGDETKLVRVPRVLVQELRLDKNVREELIDWQYEAGLNRTKIQNLYMIPFDLSDDGVVQAYVKFIDKEGEEEAFPKQPFSELTVSLLPGDRIIAVDGFSVSHAPEILQKLQKNQVNIIVERPENPYKKIFWKEASALFDNEVNRKDLNNLIASIGTKTPLQSIGNLYLLKPVLPKMRKELQASLENQTLIAAQVEEQKKIVSAIEDPEKRAEALRLLNNHEKQLLIGLPNVQ
ncbi:MAG TPA: site-2 protease family protein, partial [Parachlamydiaceae bacterium]|nr:site-2 protease family protein [Parachlamydiaceae bacterium]